MDHTQAYSHCFTKTHAHVHLCRCQQACIEQSEKHTLTVCPCEDEGRTMQRKDGGSNAALADSKSCAKNGWRRGLEARRCSPQDRWPIDHSGLIACPHCPVPCVCGVRPRATNAEAGSFQLASLSRESDTRFLENVHSECTHGRALPHKTHSHMTHRWTQRLPGLVDARRRFRRPPN